MSGAAAGRAPRRARRSRRPSTRCSPRADSAARRTRPACRNRPPIGRRRRPRSKATQRQAVARATHWCTRRTRRGTQEPALSCWPASSETRIESDSWSNGCGALALQDVAVLVFVLDASEGSASDGLGQGDGSCRRWSMSGSTSRSRGSAGSGGTAGTERARAAR